MNSEVFNGHLEFCLVNGIYNIWGFTCKESMNLNFSEYFGLYRDPLVRRRSYCYREFSTQERPNWITLYNFINKLPIPQGLSRLGSRRDRLARRQYEKQAMRLDMPSMLIACGEAGDDGQPTVALLTVSGIQPEKALKSIQDEVFKRIVLYN